MGELLGLLRTVVGRRFPFKLIYSNEYWMFDTGKHAFPLQKYRMVYERLLAMGAGKDDFLRPRPASDDDLLLVHTPAYVRRLKDGSLGRAEIQALGVRFSPELVRFALLSVGGTLLAARKALDDGLALHIGGGFHHAFRDHGEGFCVLNDVAVAVERLLAKRRIRKAMIVDCDLHHGNGTAAIFAGRKDVFTFSIHQMDVYPSEKPPGTLDVGLWSGGGDEDYLAALRRHIPRIFKEFRPDLVLYLAGADPFEKDRLGGLLLTKPCLMERDRLVIGGVRRLGIPLAVVLAGGYASETQETVDIHLNTIRAARRVQRAYARTGGSAARRGRAG
jgi:acetoin utilization deacetylase AcuC-like enzyme